MKTKAHVQPQDAAETGAELLAVFSVIGQIQQFGSELNDLAGTNCQVQRPLSEKISTFEVFDFDRPFGLF